MSDPKKLKTENLPTIPAKRYFTIGEVSELCAVKPHVLRYWEQEFSQLRPVKRRGNRRYYQHHEVLLVRHIRKLLYIEGFTIHGARSQLGEKGVTTVSGIDSSAVLPEVKVQSTDISSAVPASEAPSLRHELLSIAALLR